jgi:GAF domain-containing protein
MDPDDADRLRALRGFEILDTAPEEAFDDLVRVAAYVCGTSMAAVSLVDEDRQWFKARLGLPLVETPRSESFCSHTIEQRGVLEVPDATADPRFAGSPLVRGALALRFYAAAPLITPEGFAIGTVCVLDRKPHTLDSGQRSALLALASQAMAQVVLRQQMSMTQRLEERFRAVVEQSSDRIRRRWRPAAIHQPCSGANPRLRRARPAPSEHA